MAENITNKFDVRQEKDKFILRRILEDELDAEEFLRQINMIDYKIKETKETLEKLENDLKKFKNLKKQAEEIRQKELEKAKNEIQSIKEKASKRN